MTYEAVVFDNDGVLVEPTDREVMLEAVRETFAAFGVEDPDPPEVEGLVAGVTPGQLQSLADDYGFDPAAFWRVRDRTASAYQREEVRRGRKPTYDDLDAVEALSVPAGIVSSNQQATIDFLLAHYDLDDHFETAYGREPTVESLDRRKPAPHYVDRALADLDADRALLVGDSESDVRAAYAAGIDAAFVRRPHCEDQALSVEPDQEIDGLAAVLDLCN